MVDVDRSEPLPRHGFSSSMVEGQLYVWGGEIDDFKKRKVEIASTVCKFDLNTEGWSLFQSSGSPPPELINGGACASDDHHLYVYGGGLSRGPYSGGLHRFHVGTSTWTQRSPHSLEGPRKKRSCGMVAHEDHLILFGGYCSKSGAAKPGASYDRVWTNELHTFDLREGMWSSPTVTGTRPPPCSGFTLTKTYDHRAVLFGGYQSGYGWSNKVYFLDLEKMNWRKLDNPKGQPWPVGRFRHAATILNYGKDDQQLLVTGGMEGGGDILSDVWMLDLQSGRWKEISLPEKYRKKRYGHCAAAFSLTPALTEIVMFGGSFSLVAGYISATTVLRFERSGVDWILKDCCDYSSGLGSMERVEMKRQYAVFKSEAELQYKGEKTCWNWDDHGFRLHFPENALPPGVSEMPVKVLAAVTCEITTPPNTEVVSGVYAVSTPFNFTKPVTLEIEHSCLIESPDEVEDVFFGRCSTDKPPYDLHILKGGIFEVNSVFGRIDLKSFSTFIILRYLRQFFANRYCAGLYYSDIIRPVTWRIYLVITKDTQLIKQEVRNYFQENDIILSKINLPLHQKIEFDEDKISLPEELNVQEGWALHEMIATTILKEDVDGYLKGTFPPHSCLQLTYSPGSSTNSQFDFKLVLIGAKLPNNFFKILVHHTSSESVAAGQGGSEVHNRPGNRGGSGTLNEKEAETQNERVDKSPLSRSAVCVEKKPLKLPILLKELMPLASKWHNIGVLLGVSEGKLDAIEHDFNKAEDCLREMISAWLKLDDPEPTWEELVEAVEVIKKKKEQDQNASEERLSDPPHPAANEDVSITESTSREAHVMAGTTGQPHTTPSQLSWLLTDYLWLLVVLLVAIVAVLIALIIKN